MGFYRCHILDRHVTTKFNKQVPEINQKPYCKNRLKGKNVLFTPRLELTCHLGVSSCLLCFLEHSYEVVLPHL